MEILRTRIIIILFQLLFLRIESIIELYQGKKKNDPFREIFFASFRYPIVSTIRVFNDKFFLQNF